MKTVLVADDYAINRQYLSVLLTHQGFRVVEAADGDEALAAFARESPDLLILDIAMPRLSGIEVARRIRQTSAAPILFYTATYRADDVAGEVREHEPYLILAKPSEPERIIAAVGTLLGQQPSTELVPGPPTRSHYVEVLEAANLKLTAILELNLALAAERDEERLFSLFCRGMRRILGAEATAIALVAPDLATVLRTHTEGVDPAAAHELLVAEMQGDFVRSALRDSQPRRIYGPMPRLVAPILIAQQPAGWVCLSKRTEFSDDDAWIASAEACQLGMAIESGRLHARLALEAENLEQLVAERTSELRASEESLHALSARLISAHEDERVRIAREMHDELGQLLTVVKFEVSSPAFDVQSAASTVDRAIASVRQLASGLRPPLLDSLGVAAAIETHVEEFAARSGIACSVSIEPAELVTSDECETALFRIVQEALTNIARHAGARRVEVELRQRDEGLLLEVRDDGIGIAAPRPGSVAHLGLTGIRERARALGGTASIARREGGGTTVRIEIPPAGESQP